MRHLWFVRLTALLLLIGGVHVHAAEVAKYYSEPGELFRLLPGPGSGSPATLGFPYSDPNFCSSDSFVNARTGATNGFCWEGDGDGTVWKSAAAYEVTAVGSPTTVARRVCPNGPDCGAQTSQRLPGTSGTRFTTSNVSGPTGDFVACAYVRAFKVATGAYQFITSRWNAIGTQRAFFLAYRPAAAEFEFGIYKLNAGGNTNIIGGTALAGAWHFVCGEYDFVADGSSTMRLKVDGVTVSSNTTAVGPPQTVTNTIALGAANDNANWLEGEIGTAFIVDGVSTVDATALSGVLIPPLRGTRGEAVSTTASATNGRTCTAPNGDVSILPNNRPCVTCPFGSAVGCGLQAEWNSTNVIIQSDNLDTSWTKEAGVTVTPASSSCPRSRTGAQTLALVDNTGSASSVFSAYRFGTVPSSTGPFVVAFDVATVSGSTTKSIVGVCSGGNAATCTCYREDGESCTTTISGTNCRGHTTATTTPARLTVAFTCSAATTSIGAAVTGGEAGVSQGSGCFGLAQGESNGTVFSTSFIPTTTAALARTNAFGFPKPAGLSESNGCARITVTPTWTGNNPNATNTSFFLNARSDNNARLFYVTAASQIITMFNGTVALGNGSSVFLAKTPRSVRATWNGSTTTATMTDVESGTVTTSNAFSAFSTFDSTIYIGSAGLASGGQPGAPALINNVVLGASANDCQR